MGSCNCFGCCTKCLIFTGGWWKTIQCHLKICIQFPNLMTGVQNYCSDYCSLSYELLLYEFVYVCGVYVLNSRCMCWICCLFLLVDRLLCTLNSLSTQSSSHNALYAQTNTAHNIQQNTNTNSSQFTSSQFTLNKTKIPTASNINNTSS